MAVNGNCISQRSKHVSRILRSGLEIRKSTYVVVGRFSIGQTKGRKLDI